MTSVGDFGEIVRGSQEEKQIGECQSREKDVQRMGRKAGKTQGRHGERRRGEEGGEKRESGVGGGHKKQEEKNTGQERRGS